MIHGFQNDEPDPVLMDLNRHTIMGGEEFGEDRECPSELKRVQNLGRKVLGWDY